MNSFAGPSETTHILLAVIYQCLSLSLKKFPLLQSSTCNQNHSPKNITSNWLRRPCYPGHFLRKQGDSRNFKSVSTRAPESRATCHPTDFNETLPVWGICPKLKATNWFLFWLFPGGEIDFLGYHRGNRFKIGKMYEALTPMVFSQLLWEFAHILIHP